MEKFTVCGVVTISISTDVEADSAEEAKLEAMQRPLIGLCHQCSRGNPDEEWVTSGELDGEPDKVEVDEN